MYPKSANVLKMYTSFVISIAIVLLFTLVMLCKSMIIKNVATETLQTVLNIFSIQFHFPIMIYSLFY